MLVGSNGLWKRGSLGRIASCGICGHRFRATERVWFGAGRVACLKCYEGRKSEIRAWLATIGLQDSCA